MNVNLKPAHGVPRLCRKIRVNQERAREDPGDVWKEVIDSVKDVYSHCDRESDPSERCFKHTRTVANDIQRYLG